MNSSAGGAAVEGPRSASDRSWRILAPGLALAAVAVSLAVTSNLLLPTLSALLIAIVLGVVLTNVVVLPATVQPGLSFAAKRLLRLGIVLLGLQLVLADILGLGWTVIVVVVLIVVLGIGGTLLVGRWLGVGFTQRLLIGCGFSICGAAAVAAVDGIVEAEEEEVVTAIALVVIFGTLMIPLVPLLGELMQLSERANGLWAGGSIHEVAQVVAAGGVIGGSALAVAVVVKLARVLMLAPVLLAISLRQRRAAPGTQRRQQPPLIPLFVVGFLTMVALRSGGVVPADVLRLAGLAQTALLSAAMFALGCGVRLSTMKRVGLRPFALAAASTLLVASVSLAGVLLVS